MRLSLALGRAGSCRLAELLGEPAEDAVLLAHGIRPAHPRSGRPIPRSPSRVSAVAAVEQRKLRAQLPLRMLVLACALGPFAFAVLLKVQHGMPRGRAVRRLGVFLGLRAVARGALVRSELGLSDHRGRPRGRPVRERGPARYVEDDPDLLARAARSVHRQGHGGDVVRVVAREPWSRCRVLRRA